MSEKIYTQEEFGGLLELAIAEVSSCIDEGCECGPCEELRRIRERIRALSLDATAALAAHNRAVAAAAEEVHGRRVWQIVIALLEGRKFERASFLHPGALAEFDRALHAHTLPLVEALRALVLPPRCHEPCDAAQDGCPLCQGRAILARYTKGEAR